jgi:signal transduction histidine kinase
VGVEPRLLDGLLAVALTVAAGAQLLSEEPGNINRLVPVIGTCLPLAARRRWPIAVHVTQLACAIATLRTPVNASLVALFIGVYSVAVYSRWRNWFLIWIFVGSAWLGLAFPDSKPSVPSWALQLVLGLGLWFAGKAVHDRQQRGDVLEERNRQLQREQELTTRVALSDERQRIARELHDVVAHSVSVMVVQAGAARTWLRRDVARSEEALLAAESTGREALSELRRLLGLLTEAEATPALAPQPGLDQLDRLVERVSRAGLPIAVEVSGERRALPPGIDLTAYRVLQEALTNALKYAPGAETRVRVAYGEDALELEVIDAGSHAPVNGAPSGTGRGLIGMRQRVAVYGGELDAVKTDKGGFSLRARLPLV